MSYRELRKLCETLKMLGFARLVSIESFRLPNFELVAEILMWLLQKHDQTANSDHDIEEDITTEAARIRFLKNVAELLQVKLHVKLSCKRLYSADGLAAQELLKLATVLKDAMKLKSTSSILHDNSLISADEIFDTRAVRAVAAEIGETGARLFELLSSETTHAEVRERVVNRPQDSAQVENAVQQLLRALSKETEQMNNAFGNCQSDVDSLREKIEGKRTALDRTQKRLHSLESTRPAYQDEYEKLEGELADQYTVFLGNFRNLEYLESEAGKYTQQEELVLLEHENKLKNLRERLRRDELSNMQAGEHVEDDASSVLQLLGKEAHRRQDFSPEFLHMKGTQQQDVVTAGAVSSILGQQQRPNGFSGISNRELSNEPPVPQQQQPQQQQQRPSRPPSVRRQRQPVVTSTTSQEAFQKAVPTSTVFSAEDSDLSDDNAAHDDSSSEGELVVGNSSSAIDREGVSGRTNLAAKANDDDDDDDDDEDDDDDDDDEENEEDEDEDDDEDDD